MEKKMVKIFCAVVGEITSFPMEIDENASVSALKETVKKQKVYTFAADELTLYLTTKKKSDSTWLLTENQVKNRESSTDRFIQLHAGVKLVYTGLSVTEVNQTDVEKAVMAEGPVNVLVVVPGPSFNWQSSDEFFPPLEYTDKPVFKTPGNKIRGSGLHENGQDMHLYCRPELLRQWRALLDTVVITYSLLWITGAPGSGKSCAAFAFACCLDRAAGWAVLWVHANDSDPMISCVLLAGDSKQTCRIKYSQLEEALRSMSQPTIVFADGYTTDTSMEVDVVYECKLWRDSDKEHRRLVCVCCMAHRATYIHELRGIPREVDTTLRSMMDLSGVTPTVLDVATSERMDVILEEASFELTSWPLDSYFEAVVNDALFQHVRV